MASDYARALGARLRAIRTQQGLSLHGVEEKSQGRWKAVVVGSYERGDRAVTVQRLAELADFYGVPVQELLPGTTPGGAAEPPPKLVLDLERLATVPAEKAGPLAMPASYASSRRSEGFSSLSRPSRPLTNAGDSSVENSFASCTISSSTTASGISSAQISS